MTREMRFAHLGVVDLSGQVLGVGVAVGLGFAGAGVWALVAQHLVAAISITAGLWTASKWRPGRPDGFRQASELITFGRHLTTFRVATYASKNADGLILGSSFGATALALYGKAFDLLLLPVVLIRDPISRVAIATLSRLQSDPVMFRRYYRRALEAVAGLAMPMVVFMTLDTRLVIRLVLGDQWGGAVPIFQALAVAAFLSTFQVTGSWACVPLGRAERLARWQVGATVVTIAGFLVGVRWGAIGVAVAVSVTTAVLRVPSLFYLLRDTPVGPKDVAHSVVRPAVCASAAAAGPLLLHLVPGFDADRVLRLGPDLTAYAVSYLACWRVVPGGSAFLSRAWSLARQAVALPSAAGDPELLDEEAHTAESPPGQ